MDPMKASVLVIDAVTKRYDGGGRAVTAVENFSLAVAENEFVALLGPSGCGKSTVLNMLAGLDTATTGRIRVGDRDVTGPGRDRGVVFQTYTLMPWLTALKNVELALLDEPLSNRARREQALNFLDLVGLGDFAGHLPKQLSGGMRQRVAIARALAYGPRILLMDEPFGALDAITRQEMQLLLLDIWQHHQVTVLFVTHDIEEALLLSDRVIVMAARPGRIQLEERLPFARPRGVETVASPAFQAMKSKLYATIAHRPSVEPVAARASAGVGGR